MQFKKVKNLFAISEGFRRLSYVVGLLIGICIFYLAYIEFPKTKEALNYACFNEHADDAVNCQTQCLGSLQNIKDTDKLACRKICLEPNQQFAQKCFEDLNKKYFLQDLIFFPIFITVLSILGFRFLVRLIYWLIDGFKKSI